MLIYGATGSVGVAAVEWVGNFDAELTVVCSSHGKQLIEILGVNNIIAYDLENFIQTTHKFDIIFDAVGKTSKSVCKKLLTRGRSFVTVGGLDMAIEQIAHLQLIRHLFENGKCIAIIDRVYSFTGIVAAHAYVETGRKKGDVIVTMK